MTAGPFALRPAHDLTDFDRAFRSALTTFAGAEERWAALARFGATDGEVREQLVKELGICGCGSGRGEWSQSHRGGKNPAVWITRGFANTSRAKPTFTGQALIDKAREVLAIGHPAPLLEESTQ